jgi:hypothetical protein
MATSCRPFILVFALFLLIAVLVPRGLAKEPKPAKGPFKGYLIDLACARERKEKEADLGQKHTKKCMEMPICDHSGFGLLTDSNELLPFDEGGNRKVRMLLERTGQNENLRALVQGTRSQGTKSDEVLIVNKIELRKP